MIKRVLIACEFSGVVREAFNAYHGIRAISCDILSPEDGRVDYHYQGDVRDILNDGWDAMIAHPPCTYLSNAGARHLYPKGILNKDRLKRGLETKVLFMELLNAHIKYICVENPIPSTIYELPKYSQIIQPYQFGHPYQKRTCLWLKELPKLVPTNNIERPQSTKIPGNWFNKGGKDRQMNRAKTFPGVAQAMAAQWVPILLGTSSTQP